MNQQRLSDLQELLDLLYEKLGMFEQELAMSDGASKIALKQRIKREILPSIRNYETEYWDLLPQGATLLSEPEAEAALVEIDRAVNSISVVDNSDYPPKMLDLLTEIRDKLNALDQSAAAKLKVTLPIIPMLASYELEMDTEGVLTKVMRSIRKKIKR